MIVAAGVGFEGFVGRVREKFAIGAGVKVKVKDEEGDLITLGDRDDWEMAVGMVGRGGGGENAVGNGEVGGEVGKMEVSGFFGGFGFGGGGRGLYSFCACLFSRCGMLTDCLSWCVGLGAGGSLVGNGSVCSARLGWPTL